MDKTFNYICDGQLSFADNGNIKPCPYVEQCSTYTIGCGGESYWCGRFDNNTRKKSIEDVHKEKSWTRACKGYNNECFDVPEDGICTSYYKCSKRSEYQTLNSYYIEQLNGRHTLVSPVGGCTILCEGNKAEADELIRKTKEYFGFDD